MPRGSELYSPVSQALLRAARLGQANRPVAAPQEDEKEVVDDEDAEGDVDAGFVTTKWSQVPKDSEQPEPEYLAKRRKGLPSVHVVENTVIPSATMRKTKVRKLDSDGNPYVVDVLAPVGVVVEGEIIEGDEIMTEALAPGTIVEGVGIVNADGVVIAGEAVAPTPQKKRPHPPKRKAKNSGRNRRKKMMAAAHAANAARAAQLANAAKAGAENLAADGIKSEVNGTEGAGNGDVEMGEGSTMQDGEDGSESDDDGDEGDDGDREEGELSPTPEPDVPGSTSNLPKRQAGAITDQKASTRIDNANVGRSLRRDASSSPDLPLASTQNLHAPVIMIEPASEMDLSVSAAPEHPALEPMISAPMMPSEKVKMEDLASAETPPEYNAMDGLTDARVLDAVQKSEILQQGILKKEVSPDAPSGQHTEDTDHPKGTDRKDEEFKRLEAPDGGPEKDEVKDDGMNSKAMANVEEENNGPRVDQSRDAHFLANMPNESNTPAAKHVGGQSQEGLRNELEHDRQEEAAKGKNVAHFGGDEDLLGNLERHLNENRNGKNA
jgi:hypothetical protein